MSYNVELEWDTAHELIKSILNEDLKALQEDLERQKERKKAGQNGWIFSNDIDKDIKETKRLIKACQLMLKYYGG